jgi:DNA repair protein RecO (recombination protein O)
MASRVLHAASPLLAYVLHRYDWSESSVILDMFTRDQGRLSVVAKGAKRPFSQLRCVLLPFQAIQMVLVRAPKADEALDWCASVGEVRTLRSAQWAGGHAMLTGSALFSGFYVNELLMKLLARQDPHPAIFDAYALTLPALAAADVGLAESALRAFELTMLKHLGVLPDLSVVTLTQQELVPDYSYRVLPELGMVACVPMTEGALPGGVWIALQAALKHGSLAALQHVCVGVLALLRAPLRSLLAVHLGPGVLRTRQVMRGVQSLVGIV